MDLPLTAHRIALMRSTYFSDEVLTSLTCFFIKLDMFLTDPLAEVYQAIPVGGTNGWTRGAFVGVDMRECLLAERHLTTIWRVIHGWNPDNKAPQLPISKLDIVRLWARHKWRRTDEQLLPSTTAFGLPSWELGTARHERRFVKEYDFAPGRGSLQSPQGSFEPLAPPQVLLRPDELVMREAIRRGMSLHRQWHVMLGSGVVSSTGHRLPPYDVEKMTEALMQGLTLRV